jgi:hypothetical protein
MGNFHNALSCAAGWKFRGLFNRFVVPSLSRSTTYGLMGAAILLLAWSHTVKYQAEWISFEEYLSRQFKINTSHGISPAQAERIIKQVKDGEQAS